MKDNNAIGKLLNLSPNPDSLDIDNIIQHYNQQKITYEGHNLMVYSDKKV